jgi:hypothetical protein
VGGLRRMGRGSAAKRSESLKRVRTTFAPQGVRSLCPIELDTAGTQRRKRERWTGETEKKVAVVVEEGEARRTNGPKRTSSRGFGNA